MRLVVGDYLVTEDCEEWRVTRVDPGYVLVAVYGDAHEHARRTRPIPWSEWDEQLSRAHWSGHREVTW